MTTDELSAREEIREQLYRYCRGVDRGDVDLLKRVYHPDATDDHGVWTGSGHDFAEYIVASMDGLDNPSQHQITNVLIELRGASAAVESYFVAFHPYAPAPDADEKLAFVGGRYLDRFELREGAWRIAERRVILDWTRADVEGEPWAAQTAFPRGGRREADPSTEMFG